MRHSNRLKSLTMSCAVVASLLAVAACGSSSKSDSGASTATTAAHTTDTLSKADYVVQANVVCGGILPALATWNSADDAATAAKDKKAGDAAHTTLIAALTDLRAKAAALNPPTDAESVQKDVLSVFDNNLAVFQAQDNVANITDLAGVQKAKDDQAAARTAGKAATARLAESGIKC